eukprot:NODE_212_length_12593_cov_0.662638.p1 type:complete len:606 gc:universal NODE_212_length_12593_cov_0.662638:6390-8207(+)
MSLNVILSTKVAPESDYFIQQCKEVDILSSNLHKNRICRLTDICLIQQAQMVREAIGNHSAGAILEMYAKHFEFPTKGKFLKGSHYDFWTYDYDYYKSTMEDEYMNVKDEPFHKWSIEDLSCQELLILLRDLQRKVIIYTGNYFVAKSLFYLLRNLHYISHKFSLILDQNEESRKNYCCDPYGCFITWRDDFNELSSSNNVIILLKEPPHLKWQQDTYIIINAAISLKDLGFLYNPEIEDGEIAIAKPKYPRKISDDRKVVLDKANLVESMIQSTYLSQDCTFNKVKASLMDFKNYSLFNFKKSKLGLITEQISSKIAMENDIVHSTIELNKSDLDLIKQFQDFTGLTGLVILENDTISYLEMRRFILKKTDLVTFLMGLLDLTKTHNHDHAYWLRNIVATVEGEPNLHVIEELVEFDPFLQIDGKFYIEEFSKKYNRALKFKSGSMVKLRNTQTGVIKIQSPEIVIPQDITIKDLELLSKLYPQIEEIQELNDFLKKKDLQYSVEYIHGFGDISRLAGNCINEVLNVNEENLFGIGYCWIYSRYKPKFNTAVSPINEYVKNFIKSHIPDIILEENCEIPVVDSNLFSKLMLYKLFIDEDIGIMD